MKKAAGFLLLMVLVVSLGLGCAAPAPVPAPVPEPPTPPPAPPPEVAGIDIVVSASYAFFEPSMITVAKGQTVKLTITSTDASHTFTIDEWGVNVSVGAGQTVTKEFTAEKAGTFAFYCAVPGHRSAGMEGTIEAAE